jgi:hypothetical protein
LARALDFARDLNRRVGRLGEEKGTAAGINDGMADRYGIKVVRLEIAAANEAADSVQLQGFYQSSGEFAIARRVGDKDVMPQGP